MPLLAVAQTSPEELCALDGKPVPKCVDLYNQAAESTDNYMREQLKRRANEALQAAIRKKESPPLPKFAMPAYSPEDLRRPAIEQYRSHIAFSMKVCKLLYESAISTQAPEDQAEIASEFEKCVTQTGTYARALYEKSLASIKKPGAKQALKEVHVAFATALEGIRSRDGELKIGYPSRQAALADRLTAAWSRFEIER